MVNQTEKTDITAEFVDENFLMFVRINLFIEEDAPIYKEDVEMLTCLEMPGGFFDVVYNIKGIEYFTALTILEVEDNELQELDLSKNIALTELYVYNNNLTKLDISNCVALTDTKLRVEGNNELAEIIAYKNVALEKLKLENPEFPPDWDWQYEQNGDICRAFLPEIIITTGEQLEKFAYLVNKGFTFKGRTITLGNDIEGVCVIKERFEGTFDGNGKVISGEFPYYYNYGDELYVFGFIGKSGVVKNLTVIIDSEYEDDVETNLIFASHNIGVVQNCDVDFPLPDREHYYNIRNDSDGDDEEMDYSREFTGDEDFAYEEDQGNDEDTDELM